MYDIFNNLFYLSSHFWHWIIPKNPLIFSIFLHCLCIPLPPSIFFLFHAFKNVKNLALNKAKRNSLASKADGQPKACHMTLLAATAWLPPFPQNSIVSMETLLLKLAFSPPSTHASANRTRIPRLATFASNHPCHTHPSTYIPLKLKLKRLATPFSKLYQCPRTSENQHLHPT